MSIDDIMKLWEDNQPPCQKDGVIYPSMKPNNPDMFCQDYRYECQYRKEKKDKQLCCYYGTYNLMNDLITSLSKKV